MTMDPSKYDLCEKQFIHDQRLFRLELTNAEKRTTLKFLKLEHLPHSGLDVPESEQDREKSIDREFRSRWREIVDGPRYRILSSLPDFRSGQRKRQLLCVTASGGIGKSVALAQLAAVRPQIHPGHLVFKFHISDLPNKWEEYLYKSRRLTVTKTDQRENQQTETTEFEPLLVSDIRDRIAKLGDAYTRNQSKDEAFLRNWLRAEIRQGNVTLVVDGLDEFPASDGLAKIKALRLLLSHHHRLHCVVGGRPNAITNDYWSDLFATSDDTNLPDESSAWEFWLAGMFEHSQIRLGLGNARYQQLQLLQGNIEFNPRTVDILRTLEIGTFKTLRSGADVYWHSVHRSLQLDSKKRSQDSQTFLTQDERIDILSAMAITMLMWKHDPLDQSAPSRNPRRKKLADGKVELPKAEPVKQIVKSDLSRFYELVEQRLMFIYRDWGKKGRPTAAEHIQELKRLNTSYLEISYLIDTEKSLQWRNVTQRDFFAALWMVRSASEKEFEWFAARQSVEFMNPKEESRFVAVAQCWRFVCGAHDDSLKKRSGDHDKTERWLTLVDPLFKPSQKFSRPTELMYLAWPNLLRRAGFLKKADWHEIELETARDNAIEELKSRSTVEKESTWAKDIVFDFLDEYQKLKCGSRGENAKQIIFEDLEGVDREGNSLWRDCESYVGKKVWIGHRDHGDNQPREITLDRGFELCAYPVTKRLYVLFDSQHSTVHMVTYHPKPRCPEIGLTWFDAMIFSIWCGGMLLSEWEWEYASRGKGYYNADTSRYFFGNKEYELHRHAWVYSNSFYGPHEVGNRPTSGEGNRADPDTRNGFGLYDMLGNVWEWCQNRYSLDRVSRSMRGGSFSTDEIVTRCSSRFHNKPTISDIAGCRVARSKTRKP